MRRRSKERQGNKETGRNGSMKGRNMAKEKDENLKGGEYEEE